jgi:plasmid stabilization system protein ParE
MRYTITKHPLVERDLFDIGDLISEYSGLAIAAAKVDQIVDFIDRLTDFPKIGTVRNDIHPGLRAIPASEKAVVCFVVDDAGMTIHILGISYAGADWAAAIERRR